jgi:acetyl esterase/lipase
MSAAVDRDVPLTIRSVPRGEGPHPLVIYLRGLAAPRVGTVDDDTLLAELRTQGFIVATLDYGGAPAARWPRLNLDLVALRTQLHRRELWGDRPIDPAAIYLVPAGCRVRRGVEFFRAGARRLALDLIYPAAPRTPVGALLEFSCDNLNSMGNFSLQFCTDSLLEGAASEGFAVAMADHPVAAPYEGFDPLPDSAHKVKAAVRTLRAQAGALGLNGRIVTVGFSRGSGMALLAATTPGRTDLESGGAHPGVDSSVQGAVVLSGRFTYLDLRPDDPMIPRYIAAWGDRATHEDRWRSQGALDQTPGPTGPLFLSINVSEAPAALHQMEVLRAQLAARGVPFEYHPELEPRGHRMPLAGEVLRAMLEYFRRQLSVAGPGQPASTPPNP